MAEELRLALILLGTLAIGSVILHGIWTVRRTVSEERKNAKIEAQEAEPEIAPEEQEMQKLKLIRLISPVILSQHTSLKLSQWLKKNLLRLSFFQRKKCSLFLNHR